VRLERVVRLALKVRQELRGQRGQRDLRGRLVLLAPWGALVRLESAELLVLPARPEVPGPRVQLEPRVQREPRARPETAEPQVRPGPLGLPEQRGTRVQRE